MENLLYGSVCRISDLMDRAFETEPRPKSSWENGDYVVAQVSTRPPYQARIEAPNGRKIEPLEGEYVVGAFGKRHATRGIVGDWEEIDEDTGSMHVLGGGGIMGKATSISPMKEKPIPLEYEGHVIVDGSKSNMDNFVKDVKPNRLSLPVILVLGTSMSSGKTMSARVLVRALNEMGLSPISCKLSGSGHYHDVLSMKDAGSSAVYDFVDAGLPTTVVSPETFQTKITNLLSRIQAEDGDLLVAEIGASPLEPYNGDTAIELLSDNVEFSLATASDPYSIVGLKSVLDVPIDLVTGIATNTIAGIELIEGLTGLPAMNLQLEETKDELITMLDNNLSL